ncbi:hypothetical protein ACFE04_013824 [Oxalis oulophora]
MSISSIPFFTSPPPSIINPSSKFHYKPFNSNKNPNFLIKASSSDNVVAVTEPDVAVVGSNGAAIPSVVMKNKFVEPRWVNGTWVLSEFKKNGETDWDAVIDAEVKRRKWLQDNPETTSNVDPIIFDSSIIPWWAWMKRFHLPEAELLNGRAAMIGFFMAYFVDGLTGVGLVDQMGNFFCKTLLFVSLAGVLLVRKNEDIETLKKLFNETTFYDKQWQATWQEENGAKIQE